MEYPIDKSMYQELAARKSSEVTVLTSCRFDPVEGCYLLCGWGAEYRIYPEKMFLKVSPSEVENDFFSLFLIHYLLSEKAENVSGEWISEKDLQGGAAFFRGPHEIPTHLITRVYENDLESLATRCEGLGGEKMTLGDLSFSFTIIDAVRIALIYWRGDEDFSPEARLLIDSAASRLLPLDIVYALLYSACERIARKTT